VSGWLDDGLEATRERVAAEFGLSESVTEQLVDYLATAKAVLGTLPTQHEIVFERFFDEVGDTHFVIHSPYGSRLNRAWGLAIRKRFCRKFNFELQAAALEDSIVLSLGPTHSFPLEEVAGYLQPATVRRILTQAVLAAPMFPTHWRWAASIALAVRRNRNGRKVPPIFQRSDGEDLMAVVFPEQLACAENIAGDREIPDHPLVAQTMTDCLDELMDTDGLETLLGRIAAGEVVITARDLPTPSPLAQEIITAKPFAFLDDAPAEERRTQAIRARNMLDPEEAADLAQLSPEAIDRVCAEAWPEPRNADELHDALVLGGYVTDAEAAAGWRPFLDTLIAQCRATIVDTGAVDTGAGSRLWVAAERLGQVLRVVATARQEPPIDAVDGLRGGAESAESALVELVRSRLEMLGPTTAGVLVSALTTDKSDINNALQTLEIEGFIMRGHFRGAAGAEQEWCERRLLARISRYTIKSLRRQVEAVSPAAFMRFLFDWHEIGCDDAEGPDAVRRALDRLQGFAAPAATWESSLLAQRVNGYLPVYVDECLASGEYAWMRPAGPNGKVSSGRKSGPVRNTPITLINRAELSAWAPLFARDAAGELSLQATRVCAILREYRATFFGDIVRLTGLLRTEVEAALGELVANGLVTSDRFGGLRSLITPAARRASLSRTRRRGQAGFDAAGRWSLIEPEQKSESDPDFSSGDFSDQDIETIAWVLLDRYGVVFRTVLQRESRHLPPWRHLVRTLRRLEARGEVRGGRFVNGFSGEQFAAPDAVDRLRRMQRADRSFAERGIVMSAADPLNLSGIITPGRRVTATARNRLLYRDGLPIAVYVGGKFEWLGPRPGERPGQRNAADEWTARTMLIRNDPRLTYIDGSIHSN